MRQWANVNSSKTYQSAIYKVKKLSRPVFRHEKNTQIMLCICLILQNYKKMQIICPIEACHCYNSITLIFTYIADHPLHNHPHHRLPPLGAPQELQLFPIVHEPTFHQRSRTFRSIQDIEPCFFVRVAIGIVRPDLPTGEIFLCSTI